MSKSTQSKSEYHNFTHKSTYNLFCLYWRFLSALAVLVGQYEIENDADDQCQRGGRKADPSEVDDQTADAKREDYGDDGDIFVVIVVNSTAGKNLNTGTGDDAV